MFNLGGLLLFTSLLSVMFLPCDKTGSIGRILDDLFTRFDNELSISPDTVMSFMSANTESNKYKSREKNCSSFMTEYSRWVSSAKSNSNARRFQGFTAGRTKVLLFGKPEKGV
jgi:hypothetical protein